MCGPSEKTLNLSSKRRKTPFTINLISAGGKGPFMSPLPTKLLMNWEDITTDHRDVPALEKTTWWFNNVWFPFGVRVWQAVVLNSKGTYSFMTLAQDALVFVKVCILWWVSDKAPQGRGVTPVQRLSRRTPDSMTRESRIYKLIGNSSK